MCAMRRESVQLYCRTCLCDLQTKVDEIGLPRRWYHLQTTENLAYWIQQLTSLRVQETGGDYPQFVCQECYEKFKDFYEYRKAVLDAARKLDAVMLEVDDNGEYENAEIGTDFIKTETQYEDDTDELSEMLMKEAQLMTPSSRPKTPDAYQNHDNELIDGYLGNMENVERSMNGVDNVLTNGNDLPNINMYTCEQCNRRYLHKNTLIAHIRQEHQGITQAFECEHCHKRYTNFCNLTRHMRQDHNSSMRQFQCEYRNCHRSFRHLATRRRHYQEFHQRMKRPPTPPTPPDSTLLLPELLLPADYPQIQTKRFNCSLCNEKFDTQYHLQSHMASHCEDMKYVCNICGKRKISKIKLDEHYATVHDPKNAHPCNICHKIFKCKSHVSVHIMSVHKGLRPYACHYCPMQFAAKNTLKIHERLHTGEKPFGCEVCGRRFTQLTPMKKHRLIHEKDRNLRQQAQEQQQQQQQQQQHHHQQQELLIAPTPSAEYANFGN